MKNTRTDKEPEWNPIEDGPPKPGFLENIAMPGAFALSILFILATIVDALFFKMGSREEQLIACLTGILGITLWAVDRAFGEPR